MKKYEYKHKYMEQQGEENYFRTDLAVELGGAAPTKVMKPPLDECGTDKENQPITVNERDDNGVVITEIDVNNRDGEERTGKPKGTYITFDAKNKANELSDKTVRFLIEEMAKSISSILEKYSGKDVLVIGLGNRGVTPDALGPKVVSNINVTRHIKEFLNEDNPQNEVLSVSAFAPGVLGITGIETFEMVKGVVERSKPNLIIAVDALSTLNPAKIGAVFQMADTGIVPGSGVGNSRMELSQKTMGIPVIAIGVPMVVELKTFLNKFPDVAAQTRKMVEELPEDLMITPKSIDDTADCSAEIISKAINIALKVDSLYN